jgi:hypothetical protein
MPRMTWLLTQGRPSIEIVLSLAMTGRQLQRTLLADTGAGSAGALFDLALLESDCLTCGGTFVQSVWLHGAFSGTQPIYAIRVRIPQLGFDDDVHAVGLRAVTSGVDGIAGFRFLNRFTYGNFGDPRQFGLEN